MLILPPPDNAFIRIPFTYDSVTGLMGKARHNKSRQTHRKVLTPFQRVYTESMYRLFRAVGKNKVIKTYKPIVLGRENIPVWREAAVFVGNHRNKLDPLIMIAMLKNPAHFAALKRLFECKDNLFGAVGNRFGTRATALLVKAIGALPIARETDTDYMYINLQTFQYIGEYLERKSSVVIYPEGTINREPDKNGNLLKIKSNGAFWVAERGRAVVCPVAIVWAPDGTTVENRVIISFLKPIHTDGLRAKQIAEIWHQRMNDALDSMNRIMGEMNKVERIR